jgi:type VI secretion system secreted protein VgrG
VETARAEQALVSDGVQLDDYAFATPDAELKATAGSATRRIYDYPGGYAAKDAGDARASRRLAEMESAALRMCGTGTVRAFAAGGRFTLAGHPQGVLNQSWLLRSVRLRAGLGNFDNEFVAMPESKPYRPQRRTPRPRIAGSQTAVVVGAAGEELWTDTHGRIKLQFHWDQLGAKDENSSCWVRVAQAWAGPGWGGFVLPRIGQEVVVSFLDGDPDRPLVTGCVYNGTNAPPYALPDAQTRTTLKSSSSPGGEGFNELRFEDKAGEEEVWLKAQKDLTVAVGNARKVTVTEADDTLEVSKGNRSVTVATGNETLTVAGTRTVKVSGAETHTSEADHTLKVGGNLTIEVTGNITLKASGSLTLEAGTSVSIKAGTALALEGGTTMALKGATSGTVEAGAVLEVKGAMVKIN